MPTYCMYPPHHADDDLKSDEYGLCAVPGSENNEP